ncbi:MAG: outer membrane protein assembly factor BamA, partial [Muribaculaceae bacterium]|nr:outer membrane protein assembly factor BamA [Muribaculaceae bacterium]
MRSTLLSAIFTLTVALLPIGLKAQEKTVNDTIYNPTVIFTSMPNSYELAGIEVTGAPNYDSANIIGLSGLRVGERIDIPGTELSNAAKRLMHQGLFSQVQVKVSKIHGSKAWIELALRTQPRISDVNYIGMKKGERDDLIERLHLIKGNQITQNGVDRATAIVKKYYTDKGFGNAEVKVELRDDLSKPNEVFVDIKVDRHDKVKVHKIYINGNDVLTDRTLKRAMKKTNENGDILNLFRQKKFVENDYHDDLNRIIEKYNEHGYRDAQIVTDSVVQFDDKTVDVYITVDEGKKYFIKDIEWVGNTLYPNSVLNSILDMKPGDVYNQKQLDKRLNKDEDALSNLYYDLGYLFYQLVPVEKDVQNDSISLEMRIIEGPQARIN